jgi:aspartate dehydrogenase
MAPQEASRSPARGGRVAIAGLGTVGRAVARALDGGAIPGLTLTAVAVRDAGKARAELAGFAQPPEILTAFDALEPRADIVLECAPSQFLPSIVRPFVTAGKTAVVLSCGALLDNADLVEAARAHGGQIVVPTGALLGLDAVTAAAEGTIHAVRMITRKPVRGLVGAPYLIEHGIEIAGITEPMRVFAGSPREAARGFPANLNVAVALSLAGIGPDRTELEIWADPGLDRNTHRIEVEADAARFAMTIENVPTDENPRTGRITAQSVIAYLRKLAAPLRVGT